MAETPHEAARRLSAHMIRQGYKPEALHTYTDSQGNAIYYRIRLRHPETGRKWIRSMHLNDDDTYELGDPEFANGKPLYLLPGIDKSTKTVFVVEGEWPADHLANLGLAVTTSRQ